MYLYRVYVGAHPRSQSRADMRTVQLALESAGIDGATITEAVGYWKADARTKGVMESSTVIEILLPEEEEHRAVEFARDIRVRHAQHAVLMVRADVVHEMIVMRAGEAHG